MTSPATTTAISPAAGPAGPRWVWPVLAALVLTEIGYPLTSGDVRAGLVVATVTIGYAAAVGHAWATRGTRTVLTLVAVTTGGGLAVEALGVATGYPFGGYGYTAALGPRLAGVPLVIPLAWTWMAWPAWLVAGRLTAGGPAASRGRTAGRVAVAALGLAAWDLFLDPQMVAEGYWRWAHPAPALPGVPAVPLTNYLGWLLVATGMMALLALALPTPASPAAPPPAAGSPAAGPPRDGGRADAPMTAMYLWTYASSTLAHAVFLGLPAAAGWGAAGMGLVAVPLALRLVRRTGDPTADRVTM